MVNGLAYLSAGLRWTMRGEEVDEIPDDREVVRIVGDPNGFNPGSNSKTFTWGCTGDMFYRMSSYYDISWNGVRDELFSARGHSIRDYSGQSNSGLLDESTQEYNSIAQRIVAAGVAFPNITRLWLGVDTLELQQKGMWYDPRTTSSASVSSGVTPAAPGSTRRPPVPSHHRARPRLDPLR